MVEVVVKSLGLDRSSSTPVVILEEKEGERVLPIWIGPSEASAIAMELAGMKFSRPLTHDLFATVVGGLGGTLQRVQITRVVENTYYAELIIQRDDEIFSVDARPSDSIAIALRMDAPIYTGDSLLETTSIEVSESTEEFAVEPDAETPGGLTADELSEHLRRLHPEDFGRFSM